MHRGLHLARSNVQFLLLVSLALSSAWEPHHLSALTMLCAKPEQHSPRFSLAVSSVSFSGHSRLSLNARLLQDSVLELFLILLTSQGSHPVLWLWWPSRVWRGSSLNFPSLLDPIDRASLCSALHIHLSNCPLDLSVWISNWHSKLKISKKDFLIFSQMPSPPSLPQLSKWRSHPSSCSG